MRWTIVGVVSLVGAVGCSGGSSGGGAPPTGGWPAGPPGASGTSDGGSSPDSRHDAGGPGVKRDAGSAWDAGHTGDAGTTGDASSPPPPAAAHARCGWLGADDTAGYAVFAAHAAFFDVIHPDWYKLDTTDLQSVDALVGEGDATVLDAAAANHVTVWPLVAGVEKDANGDPYVRQMLADPAKIAANVKNLVDVAVSKGYVGLDIDYEGLWQASDRAPYESFIAQLSQAMHAAGKQLSIAVPALDNANSQSAWSYADLVGPLDVLHVMGYDFHSIGTHSGPLAPLGWIDAVNGQAAATGRADKFVLGVGNYGTTPTTFCNTQDCIARCGGSYATTTDHMATCPFGNWNAGRAPNCPTGNEQLFFEDTGSMEEKVQSAKSHGLGGITYWTIGGEPDGFFAMIAKYY
jgi:spore germination protein YaaH